MVLTGGNDPSGASVTDIAALDVHDVNAITTAHVVGTSCANPATLGLDAAFPALFLALLAPLLRSNGRIAVGAALIGAGIALALTPITPAGIPVIAATAACLVGLVRGRSS